MNIVMYMLKRFLLIRNCIDKLIDKLIDKEMVTVYIINYVKQANYLKIASYTEHVSSIV